MYILSLPREIELSSYRHFAPLLSTVLKTAVIITYNKSLFFKAYYSGDYLHLCYLNHRGGTSSPAGGLPGMVMMILLVTAEVMLMAERCCS